MPKFYSTHLFKRSLSLLLILALLSTGCSAKSEDSELISISEESTSAGTKESEIYDNTSTTSPDSDASTTNVSAAIYIYVCGQVHLPGVYELPEGSRLIHAIEKAGGFTTSASTTYLNLAKALADGERIYVPSQEEVESLGTGNTLPIEESLNSSSSQNDGKVNINTATETELTSLPGIGTTKAKAIIAYRDESGSFSQIDDIKNVNGIGDGIFEQIKNQIKVSDS